jgi:hypothetical protein
MNELESLLNDTLNPASPLRTRLAERHKRRTGEIFDILLRHDLAETIRGVINRDAKFHGRLNVLVRTGGGAFGLSLFAPQILLQWSGQFGAANAIRRLERLLSIKRARYSMIVALAGIEIEAKFQLLPGVHLVPFAEVPDSPQKDRLAGRHFDSHAFGLLTPPSAVLVGKTILEPVTYSHEVETPLDDMLVFDKLRQIIPCLALIGPCAPIPLSGWWQIDSPILSSASNSAGSGSYGYPPALEFPMPLLKNSANRPFDKTRARKLVKNYFAPQGATREKIDLALNRFNQAMQRREPGDAAIDIAIALESLVGDGGTTELTWKVALRSALLASGNLDQRKAFHRVIRRVYELRSKVMHSGHIPKKDLPSAPEVIRNGAAICAAVIEKVITRGRLPAPEKWSDFDLSGGKEE